MPRAGRAVNNCLPFVATYASGRADLETSLTEQAGYGTVGSLDPLAGRRYGRWRGANISILTVLFPAHFPAPALIAGFVCICLVGCGSGSNQRSTRAGAVATSAASDVSTTAAAAAASLPSNAIAKVGSYTVTKADVAHLMPVIVVTDGNDIPKTNDPKRVVPEPPSYSACIANVKGGKGGPAAHLSAVAIKDKCALLRQALQEQALETLISTDQLIGKAAERGITASDSEARQLLTRLKNEEFPSPAAFQRYLRITRQSLGDQFYRLRELILTGKLLQAVTGGTGTPTPAQQQEFAQISEKWVTATSCRAGYVISLCSEYKPTTSKPPAGPAR
jgi:hypothetical protein